MKPDYTLTVYTYRWPYRVKLIECGVAKRLPFWGAPIVWLYKMLGVDLVTWRQVGWK